MTKDGWIEMILQAAEHYKAGDSETIEGIADICVMVEETEKILKDNGCGSFDIKTNVMMWLAEDDFFREAEL